MLQNCLEEDMCLYRPNRVCLTRPSKWSCGLFDCPLVAGCSTGHKPRPLHVNEWDFSQNKKNELHFKYNFPKYDFGHLR